MLCLLHCVCPAYEKESSRFRANKEPCDEPAFLAAVARGYYGKDGVDENGCCAVNPLTVSLEQLAFMAATSFFFLSFFTYLFPDSCLIKHAIECAMLVGGVAWQSSAHVCINS